MLHTRTLQIAKILLQSQDNITIADIAERLNVSYKTIRNDFDDVDKFLSERNLELNRKSGVGVSVIGDESLKLKVITEINELKLENNSYGSKDRQLYILYLLLNKRRITINSLEYQFYISRPSVYKDLEEARKWLHEREIEVLRSKQKGYVIEGGEKRIRRAIFDWILLKEKQEERLYIAENDVPGQSFDSEFIKHLFSKSSDFFEGVSEHKISQIISLIEHEFGAKFVPQDAKRLRIKFSINIMRIKKGYYCTMRENTLEDLKKLDNYKMMAKITEAIEKSFQIELTEDEAGYFFGIIVASKTHKENKKWNIADDFLEINKEITGEIAKLVYEQYNIRDKENFYNGIFHHLKSVANKINYGLDFYNPLEDEVERNFPEIFKLASKSAPIIKKFYDYDISKGEIGYIALHIAAAIERSKLPLRTYVIYNNSYAEVKLIMEILKNNISQIDIIGAFPSSLSSDINFEEVDLIITNSNMKLNTNVKTIVLPSLPVEEDIQNIGNLIRSAFENMNLKMIKKCHN